MTKIKIFCTDGRITAIEAKGHTGYAEEGSDIVCAAVSSVVQTALLGLLNVAKVQVQKTIAEGYLKFEITGGTVGQKQTAEAILRTMLEGVKDIEKGYPSFIKTEVK